MLNLQIYEIFSIFKNKTVLMPKNYFFSLLIYLFNDYFRIFVYYFEIRRVHLIVSTGNLDYCNSMKYSF